MVVVTDQWAVQAIVERIVAELQGRGYLVWLDLERMKVSSSRLSTKSHCTRCCSAPFDMTLTPQPSLHAQGSVMDAMSEAVEGAEVMLYGVSSLYKER